MSGLKWAFGLVYMLGFAGQALLFLALMMTAISENPINIINPLLYIQIFLAMLVTPLFWIFLAMTGFGYFAAIGAEAMEKQELHDADHGDSEHSRMAQTSEPQELISADPQARTTVTKAPAPSEPEPGEGLAERKTSHYANESVQKW